VKGVDGRFHGNYVVLPPSIHPSSGQPYQWEDPEAPIAGMPLWLTDLVRRPIRPRSVRRHRSPAPIDDSIADWFTRSTTWWDILGSHGWLALDDAGERWLHPSATSELSATVTHDCLFVYSISTAFEATSAGAPCGYTRFRAWAVLNHGGDQSVAARAARRLRTRREAT
jgi:hypothetical protein